MTKKEAESCCRKKKELGIEINICIEDINGYEYFTNGCGAPSIDWVISYVQMCFLVARRLLHFCWSNGGVKWRSNFAGWSQARKFIVTDS